MMLPMLGQYTCCIAILLAVVLLSHTESGRADSASQDSNAEHQAFWRVTPVGPPPPHRPACCDRPFDQRGRIFTTTSDSSTKPAGETGGRTRQIIETPLISITYPNGARLLAEVADTPAKRARGLMFRDRLATDRGMLFIFEESGEWSFWMKNTKIALDILWLGRDKGIVYLEENVPGCRQDPCPEYKSNKKALYALELPAGTVKREQLAKGMKLQFDLPTEQSKQR
jgi:uncharacterized membrane protein (UPF0127 family)